MERGGWEREMEVGSQSGGADQEKRPRNSEATYIPEIPLLGWREASPGWLSSRLHLRIYSRK